jgi:hypothetical protein
MDQVFLSYKSTPKERSFAGRLRAALADEGIEVFADQEILRAGDSWERTLSDHLDKVAAVVFLIGPEGRVSEEQRDEATAVFRAEWEKPRNIPLIPVITGETDLPPFLRQVHAIEVSDVENGWPEAAKKIKLTLTGAPAAAPTPSSGQNEQQERLLEIRRFADSLKATSESYSRENLAR